MIDAYEYGRALFLITEEDGVSDSTLADVKAAEQALRQNPDYSKLLDSPALSKDERISLAGEAFGKLDFRLVNLIKILTEKRCVRLLPKVAESYYNLYDDSRGILRVEAISAMALTEEQKSRLVAKLTRTLGKKIVLKNSVDATILGGMKLRYSGTQLDGSIKTRLDKFEAALKNTVI